MAQPFTLKEVKFEAEIHKEILIEMAQRLTLKKVKFETEISEQIQALTK